MWGTRQGQGQIQTDPRAFPAPFRARVEQYSFPIKELDMLVGRNPQHWFLGNRQEPSRVEFAKRSLESFWLNFRKF